jgi:hypothetical protein
MPFHVKQHANRDSHQGRQRYLPGCRPCAVRRWLDRRHCCRKVETLERTRQLAQGFGLIETHVADDRPDYSGEKVLTADLDPGEIAEGKFDLDVVTHDARPDVFRWRSMRNQAFRFASTYTVNDEKHKVTTTCQRYDHRIGKVLKAFVALNFATVVSHPLASSDM